MKSYDEFERTVELVVTKGKNKNSTKLKQAIKDKDGLKNSPIQPYEVHKQNGVKNIGLLLEDLIVIDIDEGHAEGVSGSKSFNSWLNTRKDSKEIYNQVVNTMRVRTPSNGVHIFFFIPKGMAYKDIPRIVNREVGIDILTGKYNYVPAPNTDRGDGKYELFEQFGTDTDKTPMVAPDWVFDLIEYLNTNDVKKKQKNKSKSKNEYSVKGGDHPVERILQAVAYGFGQGERNERMTSLVGTLKWYVDNNLCRESTVIDYIALVSEQCEPPLQPNEVLSIWNSIMND